MTEDNLPKSGWTGNDQVSLCEGKKCEISHLFFGCNLAKLLWQVVAYALILDRVCGYIDDLV